MSGAILVTDTFLSRHGAELDVVLRDLGPGEEELLTLRARVLRIERNGDEVDLGLEFVDRVESTATRLQALVEALRSRLASFPGEAEAGAKVASTNETATTRKAGPAPAWVQESGSPTSERLARLEEELAVGRQIQLSMLPKSCPVVPGWQFRDIYLSARQVGGDFYDFFELPDQPHLLGLVIGDVSGKGVPAALFMGISRTL
ncbi:MAG: hypothetical protein ABFS46_19105, partial [Myxococcota bacterium]